MGKTAETVIVLSFAYFSQFPPQFSPCENCAPIVQTTLWNYIRPCSASPYRTSFFTYIMPAPLSTAAETSAILSFAYFSQFPPQFSPCENCAPIVQTTLWNYIRPCSASPYRTSFLPTLCLHLYPQLRKLPLFSHSHISRSFRRSFRPAKTA